MKYELKKSEKGKRTTVMMTMSQALMRRPEKNSARRSQDETEEQVINVEEIISQNEPEENKVRRLSYVKKS
jgi:hypothetical protein